MKALVNFLKYNNIVPITLGVIFLGASGAYAAQNPESLYAESQEIVSIDNTYIVNKDLSLYTPQVHITGVTEDEEYYHVLYTLSTIDLDVYRWKDVLKDETMRVSKADLGPYRDLGVYVTQQLKQIVDRELAYLKEVQESQRRRVTVAMLSTTYSGLVGRFLDAKTEELPGYTPVIVAPPEEYGGIVGPKDLPASVGAAGHGGGSGTSAAGLKIGLHVLGNNPARIPLRSTYADLGAVLIDPYNTNVGVYIYMDDARVQSPNIDTSTSTTYAVEYRATDPSGVEIMARRIVIVGDATDPGGEVSEAGNTNPIPAAVPGVSASEEPAPASSAPTPGSIPEPAATMTEPVVTEEPAATTTEPVVLPDPAPATTTEPTPEVTPEPAPTSTATTTLQ